MNYRLGAFGWLGGEKFSNDGGFPNLGSLDQKYALEWVESLIGKFGGDPSRQISTHIHSDVSCRLMIRRITVMGQSAGASSIMHHITGYGGKTIHRLPFSKAIIQTPGLFPQPDPPQDDAIYTEFLKLTGAKDVEGLVKVDTQILQYTNVK